MAKNLSERIADRMRDKKATVGAQNRGAFLALKGEIIQALDDRWPVKTIWETLHDEGKVKFSYQAFRNYVNSLILAPKQGANQKISAVADHPMSQPNKIKQIAPATPRAPAPPPAAPQAPAGFIFNANPDKKALI
ncbi:TraK family protein [Pseudomonas sp. R9.37]|uniref:TraK family protein n=1 Tax=Pseudomonas sp. R9.37 TaxID=1390498 RepID=UPI000D0CF11D|nr:TraK family protein [Pseudomonas sp. R9.37]PSL90775.1 hypothetical protein C7U57_28590 [Pseudomonas sp. R9.37]